MSQPSPKASTPRALDRVLTLSLLDDVYRVAAMDKSPRERSQLLTIALREHVSEAVADNQMKKTVSRIWFNPPEPAAEMIRWAIDHPDSFPDRRVMHTGAMLATVPYIGSVITQLGRCFALNEQPTVVDVRRRIVAQWGASSTVRGGVGKTVTSLRCLGLVSGGGRVRIAPQLPFPASPLAATWLIHAAMLARQVQALDVREALEAPELFWVSTLKPSLDYPLLEIHSEGINRRVWAVR